MNYHSITNQRILGDFVAREVIMNASLLVTDVLEAGKLDYEDIENYYVGTCPKCADVMKQISTSNENEEYYKCDYCGHTQIEVPESEPQEIYEWWFVTEWLFEKLKDQNEPVIESKYGHLWGRCATGQAILLDGVIGRIAEELEILEGQRNDWSKQ